MDDFIISGSFGGYTYLGEAHGRFRTQQGELREFVNLYVASPVSDFKSEDFDASGWKAEKKSCVSLDVLKDGFKPGDQIRLFFDDKNRVVLVTLEG